MLSDDFRLRISFFLSSLNPYSNGMLSDFVLGMLVSISNRLNPYSNGMLSDFGCIGSGVYDV